MYFFLRHTDNLDGTVRMSLADIACSEPLPAILLEEVLLRFIRQFVVTSRNNIAADQNLSSGMRMVSDSVTGLFPIL